jgi:hypothetical protein
MMYALDRSSSGSSFRAAASSSGSGAPGTPRGPSCSRWMSSSENSGSTPLGSGFLLTGISPLAQRYRLSASPARSPADASSFSIVPRYDAPSLSRKARGAYAHPPCGRGQRLRDVLARSASGRCGPPSPWCFPASGSADMGFSLALLLRGPAGRFLPLGSTKVTAIALGAIVFRDAGLL